MMYLDHHKGEIRSWFSKVGSYFDWTNEADFGIRPLCWACLDGMITNLLWCCVMNTVRTDEILVIVYWFSYFGMFFTKWNWVKFALTTVVFDVVKWKHFLCFWPFVYGESAGHCRITLTKGQKRGAFDVKWGWRYTSDALRRLLSR